MTEPERGEAERPQPCREESEMRWKEEEKERGNRQKERIQESRALSACCTYDRQINSDADNPLNPTGLPLYISPTPCTYTLCCIRTPPTLMPLPPLSLLSPFHSTILPSLTHPVPSISSFLPSLPVLLICFMPSFCCPISLLLLYLHPPSATQYYGTVCVFTTMEVTLG